MTARTRRGAHRVSWRRTIRATRPLAIAGSLAFAFGCAACTACSTCATSPEREARPSSHVATSPQVDAPGEGADDAQSTSCAPRRAPMACSIVVLYPCGLPIPIAGPLPLPADCARLCGDFSTSTTCHLGAVDPAPLAPAVAVMCAPCGI